MKAAPRSQIPVHFSGLILPSLLLLTAYIGGGGGGNRAMTPPRQWETKTVAEVGENSPPPPREA